MVEIIIGKKYKIVGTKGGCCRTKCKNCSPFNKGIIVTGFNYNSNEGRIVEGIGVTDKRQSCNFHPDDLRPFKIIDWRKEMEK